MRRVNSFLFVGLIFLGIFLSGCMTNTVPKFRNFLSWKPVKLSQSFEIRYFDRDSGIVGKLIRALDSSYRRVRIWGDLRYPLRVLVFPDHESLELAVQRRFPWLRAWALFSEIYIQSPFTWEIGPYYYALVELMTHELTHVAMYQLCCEREDWYKRRIPLWFREGMASFTARQGYRRWTKKRLRRFFSTSKGRRIWAMPEFYLAKYQAQIYSLAHWEFVYLVNSFGIDKIRNFLITMRDKKGFDKVFLSTFGLSQRQFRLRAWKWIAGKSAKTLMAYRE